MNFQHFIKSSQDRSLSVLWNLPYTARRKLFIRLFPDYYCNLQKLRYYDTCNSDFSLVPFDQHKCIFVHVPKCGGISVSRSLFGSLVGTHIAIKTFQIIYDEDEFQHYFKFTFVRNPWDRLVSAYHFLKNGGMTEEDREWSNRYLGPFENFETFVKQWVTPSNINSWQHFKPQHRYIVDPRGNQAVDYVGRFENLCSDFKQVATTLGIDAEIAHHNKTEHPKKFCGYRSYYTEETKEIVAKVYRRDIEIFNYEFSPS